ncbi:MAG: hypothetical protein ACKVWR_19930 [Acidimicrobiales bacterium]
MTRMPASRARAAGAALVLLAGLAGLAPAAGGQGPPEPEVSIVKVTGARADDPSAAGEQAETALSAGEVDGARIVTLAYNDVRPSDKLQFTPEGRTINDGASLMGWSSSRDGGATWRQSELLTPPPGWFMLWGDPALARSPRDPRLVFLSNLAGVAPPAGAPLGPQLAGACIARSTDGGVEFAVVQCLSNERDFYDGGTMAADSRGRVYAAYWNTTRQRVDVWAAPDEQSPFTLLPTPFPGSAYQHPRLRVDPVTDDLFVASLRMDNHVHLARWRPGEGWSKPVSASPGPVVPSNNAPVGSYGMRYAWRFSFDVRGDADGPALRVVYVAQSPDEPRRTVLRAAGCAATLEGCRELPLGPSYASEPLFPFNPDVLAYRAPGAKVGWTLTYSGEVGGAVGLYEAPMALEAQHRELVAPRPACSDTRIGGGYWGDYDQLAPLGVDGGRLLLAQGFTDSSLGCTVQWRNWAQHTHVSLARFAPLDQGAPVQR